MKNEFDALEDYVWEVVWIHADEETQEKLPAFLRTIADAIEGANKDMKEDAWLEEREEAA